MRGDGGRRSEGWCWGGGATLTFPPFTLAVCIPPLGFLFQWPVHQDEMSFHQCSSCFIESVLRTDGTSPAVVRFQASGFCPYGGKESLSLWGAHTHAGTPTWNRH